jgi:hypothetical protein
MESRSSPWRTLALTSVAVFVSSLALVLHAFPVTLRASAVALWGAVGALAAAIYGHLDMADTRGALDRLTFEETGAGRPSAPDGGRWRGFAESGKTKAATRRFPVRSRGLLSRGDRI